MKLIVQPETGVAPIVTAITHAKKTVDVLIFRLDRNDIAHALEAAVARGVVVRALTAHTNRGGQKSLRKLEMQLLEGGVTVSRTAHDLIRYHGKLMILDGRLLHIYGFNFTTLDLEASRSFGVITRNRKIVQEGMKLFEDDFNRRPYAASHPRLVVSPENSRERLTQFLRGAKKQLLIYDPKITDDGILKVLTARAKAGVEIRIIGKLEDKWHFDYARYPGRRLHVRAIVRDGSRAFIGSQSLRRLELDKRREIGIIVTDPKVVREMQAVFEDDWAQTDLGKRQAKALKKLEKKAEKKGEKLPSSKEERLKLAAAS